MSTRLNKLVRQSLKRALAAENAGLVADEEHGDWFRELFGPSVTAGILRPVDLAGYRSGQVYIRNSMHVPPNAEAVRDMMPTFFELLRDEPKPEVRVVLGHFIYEIESIAQNYRCWCALFNSYQYDDNGRNYFQLRRHFPLV